jgi:hypothetical protein
MSPYDQMKGDPDAPIQKRTDDFALETIALDANLQARAPPPRCGTPLRGVG